MYTNLTVDVAKSLCILVIKILDFEVTFLKLRRPKAQITHVIMEFPSWKGFKDLVF